MPCLTSACRHRNRQVVEGELSVSCATCDCCVARLAGQPPHPVLAHAFNSSTLHTAAPPPAACLTCTMLTMVVVLPAPGMPSTSV